MRFISRAKPTAERQPGIFRRARSRADAPHRRQPGRAGRYALEIYTQNDRGFENGPEKTEIAGKAALATWLIDEGVSPDTIYDELEMDAPKRRPLLVSLLLSLIIWVAIAAAAVTLSRCVWHHISR